MMKRRIVAAVMALAVGFAVAEEEQRQVQVAMPPLEETYPRFVINTGDCSRLEQVFSKGLKGEPITVAVIGGSITAGSQASDVRHQWGSLLTDWFRRTFPKSKVNYVNAGIGATGTGYGVFRASRDVLSKRPDVVGVEFAVNDKDVELSTETDEGLIRRLLLDESLPFVFQLSMVMATDKNSQARHLPVSRHYGLFHFSFKDALLPVFRSGRLTHRQIARDELHPEDVGHAYVAALLCRYLDGAYADFVKAGSRPRKAVARFPGKPLTGNQYDTAEVIAPSELKIVKNVGFTAGAHVRNTRERDALHADRPGAKLEFEVEAEACDLLYFKLHSGMGRSRVCVDGVEKTVLDGWFDQTWGGYTPTARLWRNSPGRHVVSVEVLSEKNPASDGHWFEIDAVLVSGCGKKDATPTNDVFHAWHDEPPDQTWTVTGQYPQIPGAQHVVVFKADEGYGGYNHCPSLAFEHGLFHAVWTNNRYDEDCPGQRILHAVSRDGIRWSRPLEAVPSLSPEAPWGWPGYILWPGGFVRYDGRTFIVGAVGEYTQWTDKDKTKFSPRYEKHVYDYPVCKMWGKVARELKPNAKYGKLFSLFTEQPDPDKLICQIPPRSEVEPGFELPRPEYDLVDAMRRAPDRRLCEPAVWKAPDGKWVCYFRDDCMSYRKWISVSSDGRIWSRPQITDVFDAPSLSTSLTLDDGRILFFGNHGGPGKWDKEHGWRGRDPLMVSVSRDGRTFSNTHTVFEGQYHERVKPNLIRSRGGSAQYPAVLLHEGKVYVIYSNGKENIELTVFPVSGLNK